MATLLNELEPINDFTVKCEADNFTQANGLSILIQITSKDMYKNMIFLKKICQTLHSMESKF